VKKLVKPVNKRGPRQVHNGAAGKGIQIMFAGFFQNLHIERSLLKPELPDAGPGQLLDQRMVVFDIGADYAGFEFIVDFADITIKRDPVFLPSLRMNRVDFFIGVAEIFKNLPREVPFFLRHSDQQEIAGIKEFLYAITWHNL
jgi:hypothetical protein